MLKEYIRSQIPRGVGSFLTRRWKRGPRGDGAFLRCSADRIRLELVEPGCGARERVYGLGVTAGRGEDNSNRRALVELAAARYGALELAGDKIINDVHAQSAAALPAARGKKGIEYF